MYFTRKTQKIRHFCAQLMPGCVVKMWLNFPMITCVKLQLFCLPGDAKLAYSAPWCSKGFTQHN